MGNSIYDQMAGALAQTVLQGQRSILYRGKNIPCVVLLGNTTTALDHGGLKTISVIHVKIPKASVPIGSDGEPHTNEPVMYPAVSGGTELSKELMIDEVVAEEYAYNFTLVDPTK